MPLPKSQLADFQGVNLSVADSANAVYKIQLAGDGVAGQGIEAVAIQHNAVNFLVVAA